MFIPLHDHNKIKHVYKPFVNWALLATNVFVSSSFSTPASAMRPPFPITATA